MLSQGLVLGDRYRLNERIATGGMGDVWRCTDLLLEREVAVKALLPSLGSDPTFTTRFRSEARVLAALRHPGIVLVHDFGEATLAGGATVSYLVMEYVDGESLLSRVNRAGPLSVPETMSIVAQAAQALHAAHTAGVVHRDVKPGNLLLRRDGTVVLVDFGIARSAASGDVTSTNMVLGTAFYMSPEQVAGEPVSAASDIYALGAVTYYCLTGSAPFTGDDPVQVAHQHVRSEPPALPAAVPAAVAALVARALAKNPADRHRTAAEFAQAAHTAQHATPAIAVPPASPVVYVPPLPESAPISGPESAPIPGPESTPIPRPARQRSPLRWVAIAGIVAAVAALTVFVATMLFPQSAEQSQRSQSSMLTEDSGDGLANRPTAPNATRKTQPTESAGRRSVGPSTAGRVPAPSAAPSGAGDKPAPPPTTSTPTAKHDDGFTVLTTDGAGAAVFVDWGEGAPGGGWNDDYLVIEDRSKDAHGIKAWAWLNGVAKGAKYNGNGVGTTVVWDPFGNVAAGDKVTVKVCLVDGSDDPTPFNCRSYTAYSQDG